MRREALPLPDFGQRPYSSQLHHGTVTHLVNRLQAAGMEILCLWILLSGNLIFLRFLIAILQVSKKDSGGEQHKGIGPKISMVMSGGPTQLGVQLLDWTMGYEEHLSL